MDHEIIWLGKIRQYGDKTPNYLRNEQKNIVEFRTIKDKKELGYFDKNKCILYLNGRYKMQYKAIKRQIKHDYAPISISEYLNIW